MSHIPPSLASIPDERGASIHGSPATGDPPEASAIQSLRAAVLQGEGELVSIDELIERLDGRAFGMGVLLFMAPVCLPMPPGVHTLAGVLLLLFAVQLSIGRKKLWLPHWIRRRRIQKTRIVRGLDRIQRFTGPIERIAKPRWLSFTGGAGTRAVGLVLIILAVILILPIPILGNMPPAIAACILALSLAERDGALILAGFVASVAAIAITSALAFAAIEAIANMLGP